MAILGRFTRKKSVVDPTSKSSSVELTVGDYANAMPRIRLGEFFRSFARQIRWMIPMFILGVFGVWFMTKDITRTYTGEGRILVQLGSEYVYESVTGSSSGGVMMTPDHIVLNEIAIMKTPDVIESVVSELTSPGSFGPQRFAKAAFSRINSAQTAQQEQNAWVSLYKGVGGAYKVSHQAKSSIVNVSYEHEDPEIAVVATNAFIDEYLKARKELFVEGSGDAIGERRRATQEQLNKNEREIHAFLVKNGISDFDSERTGVTERTENLRTALNQLRGDLSETERALATAEQQLGTTEPLINIYVDDRASQRIAQAELELKQLLAKYLPNSAPVIQKRQEISELKTLQSNNVADVKGGRRVGPNPVYQDIVTRRNELQSRADSLREKEYVLQNQLSEADRKVRRLQNLNPSYQNLLRERETLDTRLKNYTAKEQEAIVNQDQAEANSENVRVISYANRPRKGGNTRKIMLFLGSVAWGFILFILALIKVFTNPKLYVPGVGASESTAKAFYDRRSESRDGSSADRVSPAQQPYHAPTIPEAVPYAATYAAADTYQDYHPEQFSSDYIPQDGQQHHGMQPYQEALYDEPHYTQPQNAYDGSVMAYGDGGNDTSSNPYLQPQTQITPSQNEQSTSALPVLGAIPTQPQSY